MNEKREFQRSESFAAAALLALSGGLLDAYTYLCRGGVFANAQTGNMVLLAIRAAEGKWQEAGRYLIPILAFAAGVMVAETVKRLHRSAGAFHWRHTVPLYRCVSEQAPGSLRTAGCYFAVIACVLCGAALGGLLLPVLGQWTVLVAAAEQAAVFVWMWIR